MRIEYKTGDLLAGPERFIAHGCNARGVMGSGIAKQIRDEFPEVYERYRQWWLDETKGVEGRTLSLGLTQVINCGDKVVINCITQRDYGRVPGRLYADYGAIRRSLQYIEALAVDSKPPGGTQDRLGLIEEVGFPLIGAGLANGSWKTISGIIEEEAKSFRPIVYLYDGVMPTS